MSWRIASREAGDSEARRPKGSEVRVPVMHVIVDAELKNFLWLVGVNELPRIHLPILKIQSSRG
jgi:hypothetical protein